MEYQDFLSATGLANKVFAITRQADGVGSKGVFTNRCLLSAFQQVFQGKTICYTLENGTCGGGLIGTGLRDGMSDIPGGFGYFISYGRGEGFREGERFKSCPTTGERMITAQPQKVLGNCKAITVGPYVPGEKADLVTLFCNPDQLGAMISLFNYGKSGDSYDLVIAPPVSGCASIFRIPFGELKRDEPRAVIGLGDITARILFEPNLVTFTVAYQDFLNMLADGGKSFLITQTWQNIRKRLD